MDDYYFWDYRTDWNSTNMDAERSQTVFHTHSRNVPLFQPFDGQSCKKTRCEELKITANEAALALTDTYHLKDTKTWL